MQKVNIPWKIFFAFLIIDSYFGIEIMKNTNHLYIFMQIHTVLFIFANVCWQI